MLTVGVAELTGFGTGLKLVDVLDESSQCIVAELTGFGTGLKHF